MGCPRQAGTATRSAQGGSGGLWGLRRYASGMDPTVTGALIAGGAALIGFGASAFTTRVTVRANRQIARDERFWGKKTQLYETISAILKEGDVERYSWPPSETDRGRLQDLTVSLRDLTPRIRLYGSASVRTEFSELERLLMRLRGATGGLENNRLSGAQNQQTRLLLAMTRDLRGDTALPLTRQQRRIRRIAETRGRWWLAPKAWRDRRHNL